MSAAQRYARAIEATRRWLARQPTSEHCRQFGAKPLRVKFKGVIQTSRQ